MNQKKKVIETTLDDWTLDETAVEEPKSLSDLELFKKYKMDPKTGTPPGQPRSAEEADEADRKSAKNRVRQSLPVKGVDW